MRKDEKIRWLSLYVENTRGLQAKIANLFTGKGYNVETFTAGITEDPTITRITLSLRSNDEVFEQAKKQLVRMIDVIKVMDFKIDYLDYPCGPSLIHMSPYKERIFL